MAQAWSEVEQSQQYQALPQPEQQAAKQQYFDQVVSQKPQFQALPREEQAVASGQFFGSENLTIKKANAYYNDGGSSKFEKQMTAGMYQHVPFGKDLIKNYNSDEAQNIENTPQPKTWDEKLGRFVGSAAGILPAFATGEGIGGALAKPAVEGAASLLEGASATGNASVVAKAAQLAQKAKSLQGTTALAGGSVGIGTQTGLEAKQEGATTGEAIKKGAIDAGATLVGGKLLEGVASGIGNAYKVLPWTASRINNSVIKPQLKDLRFGSDPGGFLARNVKSPDNTLEGWKGATEDAVNSKIQEAKNIVADKKDKTVNVKDVLDKIYTPAMDEAAKVGDDNLLQQLMKDRQTLENNQVVVKDPNTGEVKIGSSGKRNLENLPLSDAIDLKRTIGKMTTDWTKGSEYLKALQSTRRQAYGAVRQATEDVAPELGSVNGDIADGISAKNAISRRMDVEQRQNMLGLYSVGGGAMLAHGLLTGNPGTIASGLTTIGIDGVMHSPYIMSRVASGLSNLGSMADRMSVINAVPWLKDNYAKIMQYADNSVKGLQGGMQDNLGIAGKVASNSNPEVIPTQSIGYNGDNRPQYLKDRESIPQQNIPTGEAISSNAIPMKGPSQRSVIDLSTSPRTAQNSGSTSPNLRAQVDMSKVGSYQPKVNKGKLGNQGFINIGEKVSSMQEKIDAVNNLSQKLYGKNLYEIGDAEQKKVISIINRGEDVKKPLAAAAVGTAAALAAPNANAMGSVSKARVGSSYTGQASTYGWGEKLNPTTADGTKFDSSKPFVAMRNVPLGTVVEVKDLKTGKTVELPVKDFGPGKRTQRVADLSKGAWQQLGYNKPGLTQVTVKVKSVGTGRKYNGKY